MMLKKVMTYLIDVNHKCDQGDLEIGEPRVGRPIPSRP